MSTNKTMEDHFEAMREVEKRVRAKHPGLFERMEAAGDNPSGALQAEFEAAMDVEREAYFAEHDFVTKH